MKLIDVSTGHAHFWSFKTKSARNKDIRQYWNLPNGIFTCLTKCYGKLMSISCLHSVPFSGFFGFHLRNSPCDFLMENRLCQYHSDRIVLLICTWYIFHLTSIENVVHCSSYSLVLISEMLCGQYVTLVNAYRMKLSFKCNIRKYQFP